MNVLCCKIFGLAGLPGSYPHFSVASICILAAFVFFCLFFFFCFFFFLGGGGGGGRILAEMLISFIISQHKRLLKEQLRILNNKLIQSEKQKEGA